MALMDRQYLKTPFYGSRKMKARLPTGLSGEPKKGSKADAVDGSGSHLPASQHQQTSAGTPDLSLSAEGSGSVNRVDKVWAADITYIPMKRRASCTWWPSWTGTAGTVLAWKLSNTMDTSFCVAAGGSPG